MFYKWALSVISHQEAHVMSGYPTFSGVRMFVSILNYLLPVNLLPSSSNRCPLPRLIMSLGIEK